MNRREAQLKAFDRLLTIMDELREQCPWDKKQTIQSLRHLTIEETYGLGDAILDNDLNEVKGELGDLLLHIVFYAKIGSETDDFDIEFRPLSSGLGLNHSRKSENTIKKTNGHLPCTIIHGKFTLFSLRFAIDGEAKRRKIHWISI